MKIFLPRLRQITTEAAREQEEAEKLLKLRKAEERLSALTRFQRQLSEDMRDQQQELVQRNKRSYRALCKEKGLSLVLDTSGKSLNQTELIVFCDQQPDITDDIIAILNKDAAGETVKPDNVAPASRETSKP